MYILTKSIHDNDLILAHALAGVVVCIFPCVEKGALNALPAEQDVNHHPLTGIYSKAGMMSRSFKNDSITLIHDLYLFMHRNIFISGYTRSSEGKSHLKNDNTLILVTWRSEGFKAKGLV